MIAKNKLHGTFEICDYAVFHFSPRKRNRYKEDIETLKEKIAKLGAGPE